MSQDRYMTSSAALPIPAPSLTAAEPDQIKSAECALRLSAVLAAKRGDFHRLLHSMTSYYTLVLIGSVTEDDYEELRQQLDSLFETGVRGAA